MRLLKIVFVIIVSFFFGVGFWLYSGQESGTTDFDQRRFVFDSDLKVNEI